MELDILLSPVDFLARMGVIPGDMALRDYESWWRSTGQPISDAVDRAGTPHLRMFDAIGNRIDEILFPPEYWTMLHRGYDEGATWRAVEAESVIPSYVLNYLVSFFDVGLVCPYTVSLSTALPLLKYGAPDVKERFLPQMLQRGGAAWQGATWMTEVRGGSDLGAGVETAARPEGGGWRLSGDKYFASNAGAELAVVAARPEGSKAGVRGLALFLVPKWREDGSLNYTIRRLKDKIATRSVPTGEVELRDSDGHLLGAAEHGIYLVLEVLNISRVANSVGSAALMQRALADAYSFAQGRVAFGKPVVEHPLLRAQFEERFEMLHGAFAVAWEAARLLDEVWQERPPYSERFHLFRLVAHLAKYWTAELAAQTAKWAMECYAGVGTLAENRVERWLREAMILAIWEGTPHRQMLDGMEVMERKQAHRLLFDHLGPDADPQALEGIAARLDDHLALPQDEKEAGIEPLFRELAAFTAETLARRGQRVRQA